MNLETKLYNTFCNYTITIIIVLLCAYINEYQIVNSSYNKEYWKFQNNSFKTLLKGSNRDNFYIVNYILDRDDYLNDIIIISYFIFYLFSLIHNNTYYANVPNCMKFLNYKINFNELYDYFIHNIIFNFLITISILITAIRFIYSVIPYFPFYNFLCVNIFLNIIEKIFKIMFLQENKTTWNFFIPKTE